MKSSKRVEMYNNILAHGQNLNNIFNTGIEPITLCKKLHRLERKAAHATTCLCNTNTLHLMELNRSTGYDVKQATEQEQEQFFDKITKSIHKILGEQSKEVVFINFDPRGYALKLRSEFVKDKSIMTDWGGYGILAPDFTPNN